MIDQYPQIWMVDFEYAVLAGEPTGDIHCMVAMEIRSGRTVNLWCDELRRLTGPPFPIDDQSLVVVFQAGAEMGSFRRLGWSEPSHLVDLYVEFKRKLSGRENRYAEITKLRGQNDARKRLSDACRWHGIESIDTEHKQAMQKRCAEGGPFTDQEKQDILQYCLEDVRITGELFTRMLPDLRSCPVEQLHFRAIYTGKLSAIQDRGIPLDRQLTPLLLHNWDAIRQQAIGRVASLGIWDVDGTFRCSSFERYLTEHGIAWPTLPGGEKLELTADVFRQMARRFPREIGLIADVRYVLNDLKKLRIRLGSDFRNRVFFNPFGSKTGRNQPSGSQYIFGPTSWLRSLIKPPAGMFLSYTDYAAQEIAIAAYLSEDPELITCYESGDPYLWLARRFGEVPSNATKASHPQEREAFKIVFLAMIYGMGAWRLAVSLGIAVVRAQQILAELKSLFRVYFRWSRGRSNRAQFERVIRSPDGWAMHLAKPTPTLGGTRATTLQNFPIQAAGATMLRIATVLAEEAGLETIALVHDAVMIQGRLDHWEAARQTLDWAMTQAAVITIGAPVRVDHEPVFYPERYRDKRGKFFVEVLEAVNEITSGEIRDVLDHEKQQRIWQ